MPKWTYLAIIGGILCVLFLLTRRTNYRIVEQERRVPVAVAVPIRVSVPVPVPIPVKYEQERDPLLYVDDGMYYKNPQTIEGNRLWVEQRPKSNDLEWGAPLYTDRWSNGMYNGSYKTFSS